MNIIPILRSVMIQFCSTSYYLSDTKNMFTCIHPYPCGYYGDSLKPCACAPAMVTKYQKRISGPLLDRIDIHIEVPDESQSLMRTATSQFNLSARTYHRILKLTRTIADLVGSEEIQSAYLGEALQYRPKIMV